MDASARRAERRRIRREQMTPEQKEEKNRIRRMRRMERRRATRDAEEAMRRHRQDALNEEMMRIVPVVQRIWMPPPPVVAPPAPKMPEFLSAEIIGMAERLGLQWDCPICIESKPPREFILAPCGHRICGGCRASMEASNLRRICPECRA